MKATRDNQRPPVRPLARILAPSPSTPPGATGFFVFQRGVMRRNYSLRLLRDPRWQQTRLRIMSRASFKCEKCSASDETLNVHHTYYVQGAMPWDYVDGDLICLCETCHRAEHGIRPKPEGFVCAECNKVSFDPVGWLGSKKPICEACAMVLDATR